MINSELLEIVSKAKEEGNLDDIFNWASDHQWGDMTKEEADLIVESSWIVYKNEKTEDYKQDRQFLGSTLEAVVEWAMESETTINLLLDDNLDLLIGRCSEFNDMLELMNVAVAIRRAGYIDQYKRLSNVWMERVDTEWGWDNDGAVPGIGQILSQHDLTVEQANKIFSIAEAKCAKRALKDIKEDFTWRGEVNEGEYGAFHKDGNWSHSTMVN